MLLQITSRRIMNKFKKIVTSVWFVLTFVAGSGYSTYQFYYGNAQDTREEWVREYGRTSRGTAIVKDGKVYVQWEIMKVPPEFTHYDLNLFLMTGNLSKINHLGHTHVYNGDWGGEQQADDWTDYRTIRYRGTPFNVPEDLPPGEYALSYTFVLHTGYGTFTTTLNPIYFTVK